MSELVLERIKNLCKGPVKLTIDEHLFDDDDYENLEDYLTKNDFKIDEATKYFILKMNTIYTLELFVDGPWEVPIEVYGYSTYSVIDNAFAALLKYQINKKES